MKKLVVKNYVTPMQKDPKHTAFRFVPWFCENFLGKMGGSNCNKCTVWRRGGRHRRRRWSYNHKDGTVVSTIVTIMPYIYIYTYIFLCMIIDIIDIINAEYLHDTSKCPICFLHKEIRSSGAIDVTKLPVPPLQPIPSPGNRSHGWKMDHEYLVAKMVVIATIVSKLVECISPPSTDAFFDWITWMLQRHVRKWQTSKVSQPCPSGCRLVSPGTKAGC